MKKLYTYTAPANAKAANSNFYFSFMRMPAMRVLLVLVMMAGVSSVGWAQAIYSHDFSTTSFTKPYTAEPNTIDTHLSNSSWTTNQSGFIDNPPVQDGKCLSIYNGATNTITLTFNVESGYQLAVTSFSFWNIAITSDSQDWTLKINGTTAGSGQISSAGTAISQNVDNAISGLTGAITIVYSYTSVSTGSTCFDDFTLNGSVTLITGAPDITGVLTATATYGTVANTYTITGTNSPTSFNATGLPPGLSVNTTNGQITGTPTSTAGSPYNITISATNAQGTGSAILKYTITKKPLLITGLTANNKTYDGTTTATFYGTAALQGVYEGDDVILGGTPTVYFFKDANAEPDKVVLVTGYTISGNAAGNYTLPRTGLTATIFKADQTITFGPLAGKNTASAPFELTATASSGLAVSYTSSNPAVATISGNTVTIIASGTTDIIASQAGNTNYNAAPEVTQTLVVTYIPLAFAVTGGGAYCAGTGGLPVGLANSEIGVTYTLSPGGATMDGTGAAISFGNQQAGTYTISGTNGINTTAMTGSALVTENALPIVTATSNSPVFEGGTLNLTGGPDGMTTYAWTGPNNYNTQNPTKANVLLADAGTYTLTVTDANSCTAQATTAVIIHRQLDWANLQSPGSGTIALGDDFTVYARVYEPGVTDATGQGTGITAWIGYGTSGSDLSGYTWIPAVYYTDVDNNDEYMLNLGAEISTKGTFYYASRFQIGTAAYVYGGYSIEGGGFWNGTTNISGTLTVVGAPVAYNVTGTGSYCIDGLQVGVDNSEMGVTYTLWKDGVETATTKTGTGSAITFDGNQTEGTYTVTGTNAAGTTPMTGSAVITLTASPTAYAGTGGTITAGTPYTLSGATASNYTSVSWAKSGGIGNGSFNNNTLVNPTFTGSADGPITLTLTAYGCDDIKVTSNVTLYIISTDPVTWLGTTDEDWNLADNWLPAFVPTSDYDVVISASAIHYPTILSSDAAVCKNITLESGASIIGNENLSVSGTQTIERTITTGKWHYISAANNNTNSGTFTDDFLQSWSEPSAAWTYITATNAKLNRVQGYNLWVKASAGASKTFAFTGTFNSGTQSIAITHSGTSGLNDGANFVGNPYPSYLDWDGLRTNYGAIYYWNGTAYVTWNNGGGGSRYVSPMQGFFIVAPTAGTFTLNNVNRTNSTTTSFYKSGLEIKTNTLVLSTVGESYSDKLFVNFNPAATAGFELQKDAYKFLGYTAGVSELYSYADDKKLSIDVRPETSVIQLGFTNTKSGEYQIGIDKIADIPVVYLEDTKTSTFHDLLTGPYAFSYTADESDKRFLLHFGTTSLKENEKASATVYSYQKTVYINMADQSKGDIFIYNMAGQQVATRTSMQGMIEIKLPNTGNYIVKVISRNNTVVRKVFIQ